MQKQGGTGKLLGVEEEKFKITQVSSLTFWKDDNIIKNVKREDNIQEMICSTLDMLFLGC